VENSILLQSLQVIRHLSDDLGTALSCMKRAVFWVLIRRQIVPKKLPLLLKGRAVSFSSGSESDRTDVHPKKNCKFAIREIKAVLHKTCSQSVLLLF
jgi:hypothetical protein